jgi:hypothetical protein
MKPADDFYVGYAPNAPRNSQRILIISAVLLISIAIAVALVLALKQNKFSTASFEYKKIHVKGYLYQIPVPYVKVYYGKSFDHNNVTQTIILTGNGKHGAEKIISEFQKENLDWKEGTLVEVEGNPIYGDGKLLLQLESPGEITMTHSSNDIDAMHRKILDVTSDNLIGEIVDPKCYFGVMKPGEGKTHRSCAIRCISGGIPPVLKTSDDYFLIVGENFQPIASEIVDIIGDNVSLTGDIIQLDDWKMLRISTKELLSKIEWRRKVNKLIAHEPEMTWCE